MEALPWAADFLHPIQMEYKKPPPVYKLVKPSSDDIQYIKENAAPNDPFDSLGLKRETLDALESGKAHILKCSAGSLGTILIVSFDKDPIKLLWNTWWRIVRILATGPVRILIYAHPKERLTPERGLPIDKEHVNGGAAMRCDPRSVVIYRKEEVTRVLCHELFHTTCSDPYHLDTPQIEADTEAWAELVLCALAAQGNMNVWNANMKQQIIWSLKQAATVRDFHDVQGPKNYGWRYLTGRLDVWRRLGISVSEIPARGMYTPVRSLRFTVCEPKNV